MQAGTRRNIIQSLGNLLISSNKMCYNLFGQCICIIWAWLASNRKGLLLLYVLYWCGTVKEPWFLLLLLKKIVSRMTLSRISENALLRSRKTSFHHLSSFWDGKCDPNLQSIFHEYGRQSFGLESRNLIVSKSSQAKVKIMRKSIGIHFIQKGIGSLEACPQEIFLNQSL